MPIDTTGFNTSRFSSFRMATLSPLAFADVQASPLPLSIA